MPSIPTRFVSETVLDLSSLSTQICDAETSRQGAFDLSRQLQVALNEARASIGKDLAMDGLRAAFQNDMISATASHERAPRLANLSRSLEEAVRLESFHNFVETGKLISPSDLTKYYPNLTDEEYLGGAIMGMTQELRRYGLGQATVRDVVSVKAAADLVSECQTFLLQLDFRNGPLRRKYDGVKYSLQALETLLYELSITGETTSPEPKRLKTEATPLLPSEELQSLKSRMDHRDELRETLIKKCRDSQKAAKQSIFALHRGDTKRTISLLKQCRDAIEKDLLPLVTEEPPLKNSGSYTGVLEEYVEARLFGAWLHGADFFPNGSERMGGASGEILKFDDFTEVTLSPEEYLGGLCDLTGEIGRYAVQRGTARDKAAVELSLSSISAVLVALQGLERCPVYKKMDVVRKTEEKMERMLYDMSLSDAAGGRNVQSDAVTVKEDADPVDG